MMASRAKSRANGASAACDPLVLPPPAGASEAEAELRCLASLKSTRGEKRTAALSAAVMRPRLASPPGAAPSSAAAASRMSEVAISLPAPGTSDAIASRTSEGVRRGNVWVWKQLATSGVSHGPGSARQSSWKPAERGAASAVLGGVR